MIAATQPRVCNKPHPSIITGAASVNRVAAKSSKSTRVRRKTRKAPENNFRLVEASDVALHTVLATKTVKMGLKSGETVILVGPERPEQLVRKLTMTGINAEAAIKSGKLFVFSLQPAISGNLSLSTDYHKVFGELFTLAGVPVDRVVIMGVDLLLNLESQYLALASVSKFTQAADEMGCKIIAQYVKNKSVAHDRLEAACSSLVNAYYTMRRGDSRIGKAYSLAIKSATVPSGSSNIEARGLKGKRDYCA